jgi:hypothetical protein
MTEKERLINEMEMVRRLIDIPKTIREIPRAQKQFENSERSRKGWGSTEPWIPWHVWKTRQLKEQIKKEYEGRRNNDISIFDQYFGS